jgi:hypothetical protein
MKKLIRIQIITNIVFLLIAILFIIGKMTDIKYTYDDRIGNIDPYEVSNILYKNILLFGLLILVILIVNLVLSLIIARKAKGVISKS